MAITPESPIATVFGSRTQKRNLVAKGLGLKTVGDLLYHFPRRYLKIGELSDIGHLVPGQQLSFVGRVGSRHTSDFFNRRQRRKNYRVEVNVRTGGPSFRMSFFTPHYAQAQQWAREMSPGAEGMFTGKAKLFNRSWQLEAPKKVMFTADEDGQEAGVESLAGSLTGLLPIYPATAKVDSFDLQRVIHYALEVVTDVPDTFPADLRERYHLADVMTALRFIHGPDDYQQLGVAQRRFRFEEALVLQLVLARRRAAQRELGGQARTGGGGLLAAFDERLPFELTGAQVTVGEEIERDLAQPHAMNRLLQGEVGSGKTLVALRAMLRVIDSGGQAALLAPTEVLAQQHHRSIAQMLGDLGAGAMLGGTADATTVALLTGSMGARARREALLGIASGEAGIVIGTHALLEENVGFADLGLVVVDEQHRFGVEQRAALTEKAHHPPHVLVMTATPIPRTVAMTVFGDLATSTIAELPKGRAPIQTNVVPLSDQPHWIDRVWGRVREEAGKGHQVYVVCPRITGDTLEEGEADQIDYDEDGNPIIAVGRGKGLSAVEDVAPELAEGPLSGLRVEALHGRQPAEEKERTMRAFAGGDVDVLISTTVIEVGVDVANATMMVLLDADRFGVSQLHQLRGRVGRGGLPGLCLLVTMAESGSPARDRLDAVAATTDGFALSRVDLEARREGDVLGASQSGFRSSLENLRVLRDEKTILKAREAADELLAEDPSLARAPLLAQAVDDVEKSRESEFMEKA